MDITRMTGTVHLQVTAASYQINELFQEENDFTEVDFRMSDTFISGLSKVVLGGVEVERSEELERLEIKINLELAYLQLRGRYRAQGR